MGGKGKTKEKLVEGEREGFSFPENSRNFYRMSYGLAVQLTSLEKNQTFDEVVKDSPAHPNIPRSSAR